MEVGKWPHFGILGSGRTLLAQKMNVFVSVHSGAKLHAALPDSKNIEAGILKKIKSL